MEAWGEIWDEEDDLSGLGMRAEGRIDLEGERKVGWDDTSGRMREEGWKSACRDEVTSCDRQECSLLQWKFTTRSRFLGLDPGANLLSLS